MAKKKSAAQIRLEYLAARTVLGFLGILPRRVALFFSIGIARLGYHLLGNLRKVGYRNLEIAMPETSQRERARLVKGSFESLGRILGEVSQFHKATPAKLEQLIEFHIDHLLELYAKLRHEGRGAIITTGHMGNWELFVFAFAAIYEPMSYLARPIDNPLIEEMTVQIRTRFGNRPINKTNSVIVASKILREGGLLGILADVNAHPKEGVFVPLFGVPACTSSGAALLAIRTNSIILPMCAVWDREKHKYVALHGEIIEPVITGDRKRDIAETTARFTAEFEKFVRAYPDQWLWIHKRWKTRPPGEKDLYK
jgi:KDO2-lipid IV(A) lauroyltransferase